MPQILNKYSFGADIGSALGSGLGQGLSYLAQNKINQLSKSHEVNNYANLLKQSGLDDRDANVLAYHAVNNPQQYHHILEQYTPRQAQPRQEVQDLATQQPSYQQALQQMQEQPQQQTAMQQYRQPTQEQAVQLSNLLQNLGNPQKKSSGLGEGVDLLQQNAANQLLKTAVQKPEEQRLPEKKAIRQEQAKQEAKEVAKELKKPVVAQQVEQDIHPLLAAKTKAQMQAQQRVEAEQKKEQQAINKAEKPYIDRVTAYKEAADDADKRLNKMETLIKKGGLPIATFYNLFKNIEESVSPAVGAGAGAAIGGVLGGTAGSLGGPATAAGGAVAGARVGGLIGGLIGPLATVIRGGEKLVFSNTEEFEKLSNDFIKNAKTIFGSRITDADLKAFMATVPTLAQSDAGKLAIINNMKSFNEASQIRYNAMREIIKENGNKIPADLEFRVQDRVGPELNILAEEFSKA